MDTKSFYEVAGPPGVYHVEETELQTRFSQIELAQLARLNILKPMGHPLPKSAKRLYARVTVEAFLKDPEALDKARKAVLRFWRDKNARRPGNGSTE